jgi:hypothetical protein
LHRARVSFPSPRRMLIGGSGMRTPLTRLVAVAVMVVMLTGMAVSAAFASQGGEPRTGSCGVGKAEAAEHLANPTAPGASEERFEPLGTCGTDVQP